MLPSDIPTGCPVAVQVWITPASKFGAMKNTLPDLPPDARVTQFVHSQGALLEFSLTMGPDAAVTLEQVAKSLRSAGLDPAINVRWG